MAAAAAGGAAAAARVKRVHFARHGQAAHNVRAEALREGGCTYQEFFDQMAADDVFDAPLTEVGIRQAAEVAERLRESGTLANVQLVFGSSLSRAIDTADLLLPPSAAVQRVAFDELVEVSGALVNAQRRKRSELVLRNPSWDFSALCSEEDELWARWGKELESREACAERGFQALRRIWDSEAEEVLVVAHGGLLSFLFDLHQRVRPDERMKERFHNCELRTARMWAEEATASDESDAPIFHLEAC